MLLRYRVLIKYCVFSEDFKIYSGLWPCSVLARVQCVYTHKAGRKPALQQNWQSSEKSQKNTIFNEHPVHYICYKFCKSGMLLILNICLRLYWNLKTALYPVMRVSKTGLETAIFGKTADVAILKEALSNAALSDEEEFDWTLLFLIVIFAIIFFILLIK